MEPPLVMIRSCLLSCALLVTSGGAFALAGTDSGAPGIAPGAPEPAAKSAPHYSVTQRFGLSGDTGWDYLTFDAIAMRLFIARSDRVQVVDPQSGRELGEIRGQHGVHGIALASDLGLGFASNGLANSVTAFELGSLKTRAEIKVTGVNPDAILYVPQTRRVYTFNGRSNDITVIDAISLEVVDTIMLEGKPEFAASDGRSIFVNIEDRALLSVINLQNDQVTKSVSLAPCEEPSGLALDAPHQRLFSVCSNGKMMVIDAAAARIVAEVPIGRDPDAVAYDAGTGLVFSSSGHGTLSVVHSDDAEHYVVVQTVTTRKSARTLALNPLSHSVYLVGADLESAPKPAATPTHSGSRVIPGTFGLLVVAP
jgi:YVTN family beta-propeller protein